MTTHDSEAATVPEFTRAEASGTAFKGRNRPSILSDIVVDRGPVSVLARLFLQADTELRKRNIRLSFASFEELVAVNEANRLYWRPLLPVFDPRVSEVSRENAFAVIGCDPVGRPVSAHAFRYMALDGATLKEELESLRCFYANPARMRQSGESLTVSAPSAATRRQPVVFSGAAWLHPAYRGQGLLTYIQPLVRALAYTRWEADYVFSFMAPELVKGGVAQNARFVNIEWEVTLTHTPVLRGHTIHAALVSTTAQSQLEHFQEFVEMIERTPADRGTWSDDDLGLRPRLPTAMPNDA